MAEHHKTVMTQKLAEAIEDQRPESELCRLIAEGADVNGYLEEEPFITAALNRYPDEEAMFALLGAGANADAVDDELMTPLMYVLKGGPAGWQTAEQLLSHTTQFSVTDCCSRTYLWYAAGWADEQLLSTLQQRGILIDSLDDDNRSPLMHAADNVNVKAVRWLLAQGAEVHTADFGGMTALMLASWYDRDPKRNKTLWDNPSAQMETVELLLAAGADVNAVDKRGETALMYAAVVDAADIARLLLEAGAFPAHKNKEGKTALDIAAAFHSKRTAGLLAAHRE